MECLAVSYLRENWDGWPLHCLIAGLLMWPAITNSYPAVMFALNAVFWPCREARQHGGFKNIWTWHRFIEGFSPIPVCGVIWFFWL